MFHANVRKTAAQQMERKPTSMLQDQESLKNGGPCLRGLFFAQAGYQITQQRQPLATGGFLNYVTWIHEGKHKRLEHRTARITQIQLEQDSGRSLHDPEAAVSLIDLNRAGRLNAWLGRRRVTRMLGLELAQSMTLCSIVSIKDCNEW